MRDYIYRALDHIGEDIKTYSQPQDPLLAELVDLYSSLGLVHIKTPDNTILKPLKEFESKTDKGYTYRFLECEDIYIKDSFHNEKHFEQYLKGLKIQLDKDLISRNEKHTLKTSFCGLFKTFKKVEIAKEDISKHSNNLLSWVDLTDVPHTFFDDKVLFDNQNLTKLYLVYCSDNISVSCYIRSESDSHYIFYLFEIDPTDFTLFCSLSFESKRSTITEIQDFNEMRNKLMQYCEHTIRDLHHTLEVIQYFAEILGEHMLPELHVESINEMLYGDDVKEKHKFPLASPKHGETGIKLVEKCFHFKQDSLTSEEILLFVFPEFNKPFRYADDTRTQILLVLDADYLGEIIPTEKNIAWSYFEKYKDTLEVIKVWKELYDTIISDERQKKFVESNPRTCMTESLNEIVNEQFFTRFEITRLINLFCIASFYYKLATRTHKATHLPYDPKLSDLARLAMMRSQERKRVDELKRKRDTPP